MAADLRTRISTNEGYLHYQTTDAGNERFGATVVSHLSGTGDDETTLGYDLSSTTISVRPVFVEDQLWSTSANDARIRKEIDIANQVFAQAGLSVRGTGEGIRLEFDAVQHPIDENESLLITAQARGGNQDVINLYYVGDLAGYPSGDIYAQAFAPYLSRVITTVRL